MSEGNYEGSLVLERLAEHDLVDEFYAAVDDDDQLRVIALLRLVGFDEQVIGETLRAISEG